LIKGHVRHITLFTLLVVIFCLPFSAYADRSIATHGKSAQARVNFKVIIAPSLSMQIGTLTTDKWSGSNKGEKEVFVKASGNFTNKDVLRFAATPSRSGTPNTRTANTFSNFDDIPALSLSHPSIGQYLLIYTPNTPNIMTPENGTRYYVLCSP